MSDQSISEIILAYDDAPALPGLIHEWNTALASIANEYEIIVVDDGSSDGTAGVVESMLVEVPALRLIRHDTNHGVGAAFRSGVLAARFPVIGYTDGDAQYSPRDLPVMVEQLKGADAVSGVRVRRADPFYRIIVSRCYNIVLRSVYGLSLRDTNSGLKLYRRRFLEKCLPASDGPFFDAEVMIKGVRAGMRVAEIPVHHRARHHGRARGASLRSISHALRELSSKHMKPFVRRSLASRLIHGAISLLSRSMASRRWPRAAAASPAAARRADI